MPEHIAIQPGRLYPQPDYTVQIDQEGKWTVTQVYLCHRDSAVALMPRPGSVHPEVPFVWASGITARVMEGNIAELTCVYTGAEESEDDEQGASAPVYTMGLSLSEEPLLTFAGYDTISDEEREALQAIITGKETDADGDPWKDRISSTEGLQALGKIQRGQTSYYSPRITWRESFVRNKGVRTSELNKIGEIDTPPGAPSLAQGRTWLLNGVTQEQEGNSFRIEREWLASDRGGWDPDIYSV